MRIIVGISGWLVRVQESSWWVDTSGCQISGSGRTADAHTPAAVLCWQAFIQRAGPEILVQDLPPKLEVVLQLAPTATQMHLLRSLMQIIRAHNSNVLRDTEVGQVTGWARVC